MYTCLLICRRFRLWMEHNFYLQALSAGCIPVFVNNDFIKPFPDRIQWRLFSYSFPTEEIPRLIDTLRSVPEEKLKEMQVSVRCEVQCSGVFVS